MPTLQSLAHAIEQTPATLNARSVVSQLTTAQGLAAVESVDPQVLLGRNQSWLMRLQDGTRVFVKRVDPELAGPLAFQRSVSFAAFASAHSDKAPLSPRLLGSQEHSGFLVYEHCGGENAAALIAREELPIEFARTVGHQLALLHSAPHANLVPATPPSPPTHMLRVGVPHARFFNFTIAEISLWQSLQNDPELVTAAQNLRDSEAAHAISPTHNDLRLDQFLVEGNTTHILDWEEFGLGDPARDLGTLAGEFIYRAVLDTVTSRGGSSTPPSKFDSASASAHLAGRIIEFVPVVRALWAAYRQFAPLHDDSLASRSVAHLGWHLVDRTIARAAMVTKLPGIERAAAGIGRRALLEPDRFVETLGFGEV